MKTEDGRIYTIQFLQRVFHIPPSTLCNCASYSSVKRKGICNLI